MKTDVLCSLLVRKWRSILDHSQYGLLSAVPKYWYHVVSFSFSIPSPSRSAAVSLSLKLINFLHCRTTVYTLSSTFSRSSFVPTSSQSLTGVQLKSFRNRRSQQRKLLRLWLQSRRNIPISCTLLISYPYILVLSLFPSALLKSVPSWILDLQLVKTFCLR